MSRLIEVPFNPLGELEVQREALAIVCDLNGMAVSQALVVLEQARTLLLATQRVTITPELLSLCDYHLEHGRKSSAAKPEMGGVA